MADSRSGITPLTGANFPTWKIQCKMTLLKYGLWNIVNGTEMALSGDADAITIRKFQDRRDRALSTIVLAVDTTILYLLGDPQDPVVVWKKLLDQFQKKSWANKLALRGKLYSLKLKEDGSVQNHLKTMTEIFEELAIVGDAIDEEDRVVHILASLPDSYSMLVTALQTSPEVPALELVTERLLYEERKIKEKQGPVARYPENALFTGTARTKSKTLGPCFFCDEMGHVKRDCEDFKKYQKDKHSKREDSAHFAHITSTSSDIDGSDDDGTGFEECIALIMNDQSTTPTMKDDKWIVDSAASSHMCNDINQFRNLKKLDVVKKIKVGDGFMVEAKAEGTVMLHVLTSNKEKVCKLHNVLLVPELKYNLLSVSKASRAGKKVLFDRHGCNFVDSSTKEIVVSAKKLGSLYYVSCASKKDARKETFRKEDMKRAIKGLRDSSFENDLLERFRSVKRENEQKEEVLVQVEEDSVKLEIEEDSIPV